MLDKIYSQVHLNRTNLPELCECDIEKNVYEIYVDCRLIATIDSKTFQNLNNIQILDFHFH
jgi:hypothetical protein